MISYECDIQFRYLYLVYGLLVMDSLFVNRRICIVLRYSAYMHITMEGTTYFFPCIFHGISVVRAPFRYM